MNILVLGSSVVEQEIIKLCKKSKFLDRIYTASNLPLKDVPNIEYTTFLELCDKAKALQIDITLVADEMLIKDGIQEIFNKNLLNIITVNKKWFNLELSNIAAKQLSNFYSINIPQLLKVPLSFPVIIRTDKSKIVKIAHSMQELVDIKEGLQGECSFLEDYLFGDVFYFLFLWDGKNLVVFTPNVQLTEVQLDRLELLKTKLCFMLSDEKADFISFFTIKTVWSKNDWYVLDYYMRIGEHINSFNFNKDFMYILNLALYQKLNELSK